MPTVKMTLVGAALLRQNLSKFDLLAAAATRRIIEDSTMAVVSGAKQRCPVNKKIGLGGRLRGSIMPKFYNNGFTGEVQTNVEYAAFVEFGTGQRGAATGPGPEALPPGYGYGGRKGMRAQPFLFPAFEEEYPKFVARIRVEVGSGFGF